MVMDYMIWPAMCGNGQATGMLRIWMKLPIRLKPVARRHINPRVVSPDHSYDPCQPRLKFQEK